MSPMEKSDLPVVARKRANKAASAAAEPAERRGGAKENADLQSTVRTQSREAVSQAQARIREAVIRNRQGKLTALLHHINIDVLRASFSDLKKTAAPGVDEVTWTEYAKRLEENLLDLHARVHTGAYRALPSRRKYIPKADGRQRPLGIAAIEDKIVQAAVVAILTPIYKSEFLGFSYGFRPKRNQHQALDALAFGIGKRRINWVLDCDVQSFFDKVSRDWLIQFVEHRIGDRQIIRLIAKWLTAGVLEGGQVIETEEGTPQGAVISPLLANIYLHHVYDQWVHQWRQRCAAGDVIVVRYADNSIVGFEHRREAEQFLADLKARLARFGLNLHPDKTRLIEFGRNAIANRRARSLGKPETFDFLGVQALLRDPAGRRRLRARKEADGQAHANQTSGDQGAAQGDPPRWDRWARQMACPGPAGLDGLLCCADERLRDLGIPASHDRTLAWRADAPQPATSIDVDPNEDDRRPVLANPSHPASVAGEAVPRHHPRWEPGALAAPAGICAGGGQQWPSLPRPRQVRAAHRSSQDWKLAGLELERRFDRLCGSAGEGGEAEGSAEVDVGKGDGVVVARERVLSKALLAGDDGALRRPPQG